MITCFPVTIGQVNAPRQEGTIFYFDYADRNPEIGENVYRIKQVEDGVKTRYSKQVIIEFRQAANLELLNERGTNIWHLLLSGEFNSNANLKVYDLSGRQMKSLDLLPNNLLQLNLEDFQPGIYLVDVQLQTERFVQKVQVF